MLRLFDSLLACSLTLALASLTGCNGGNEDEGNDDVGEGTLYDRLGGEDGIRMVVTDAVVNRIAADPKINAYFVNDGVDPGIVIECLVKQLGSLTGGPQVYPEPDGCRDMKESHEGLGISTNDFQDLAGHFNDALTDAGVAQADIDTIMTALADMAPDIVEDANNDMTVYQRVGRQPAIQTVVTDFVDRVLADAALAPYFTDTDRVRLELCLVRQVCGIDGPCEYGMENTGLLTALGDNKCLDMASSHAGLGITIEDFNALVGHLDMALTDAGVAVADKDAVLGALGPACSDIVADPSSCP